MEGAWEEGCGLFAFHFVLFKPDIGFRQRRVCSSPARTHTAKGGVLRHLRCVSEVEAGIDSCTRWR